jgi:hypothetical protein
MTIAVASICGTAAAEQKGLPLKDLPAVVQNAIRENLHGGEIRNIGKEKEDGIEQYEVESLLNGKSRDFNVDMKGRLLVVEEATVIDAIPSAARASILERVGDGKLTSVETVTRPGQPITYEAAYTDRKGKKHEARFKPDRTETKQ